MTLKELERLVQRGENECLEFKHKAADPQKIMKEVVAFSNHKGGRLIVGVDDDTTIRGVKFVEEEEYVLTQAIHKYCKPVPQYSIEKIPITAKRSVLIYSIKESEKKPVFLIYNFKRKTGRAYYRYLDKSVQASWELRQIMKARHKKSEFSWFEYGELERKLMKRLDETTTISVDAFAEFANISPKKASETLVQLTISNVLDILPSDEQDLFYIKTED
ncbi:MAG: helix-turn-helix domain-containing protein [Flammeovirgaceae bacterium]